MNIHAHKPSAATDLATPIAIQRPPVIEFGAGTASMSGRWAREQDLGNILVVTDAFNAGRVDALALKGAVTVFGTVRPEPDVPNLEATLAAAEQAQPDLVIGFGGGSAMDLAKLVAVLAYRRGQGVDDALGEFAAGHGAGLALGYLGRK
jgi:alcohol dehydrogenase class IV